MTLCWLKSFARRTDGRRLSRVGAVAQLGRVDAEQACQVPLSAVRGAQEARGKPRMIFPG